MFHSDLTYGWDVERIECPTVRGIEEGIELAVRSNDTDASWIPLKISYNGNITASSEPCKGPDAITREVRGYSVPAIESSRCRYPHKIKTSVCGDLLRTSGIQFRWMNSITLADGMARFWALNDIDIKLIEANTTKELLSDGFNGNNRSDCRPCDVK